MRSASLLSPKTLSIPVERLIWPLLGMGASLMGLLLCASLLCGEMSLNLFLLGDNVLSQMAHEQRLATQIDERLWLADARIELQTAVIHDLIAERMSLRQAVLTYQEVDRRLPDCWRELVLRSYPGRTEEISYARQILAHVACQFSDRQDERSAILSRLNRELREIDFPPSIPGERSRDSVPKMIESFDPCSKSYYDCARQK